MENQAYLSESRYENGAGVPVFLFPNPALHSFCASLYVRAGSMFEREEENGITHLIEHLVFRSVNRAMGGRLYAELDRLGLCFEGCTYKEFVRFTVSGAREHFGEGTALLLKVLDPLSLTAEDLRLELGRVKAEIREESERTTLDYFTDGILHTGTPLSRTITGTAKTLDRMSRASLSAYHKKMFSAKNVFFYLTGAVTEEAARDFTAMTDAYSFDLAEPRRENFAPVPEGFLRRGGVYVKNSKRHLVRLSVDVDMTSTSDAELTLLYDILFGDGEACRLHQVLSEERGYIYSFRATMELYRNIGVISVSYEIPPSLLVPSVSLLCDILKEIKAGIGEALDYVRAPYTDNAYLMYDSDSDFGWNRAYETQILSLPYRGIADRAAAYAAVTPERITALAKRLFVPSGMTLTVKGDKKTVDENALRALLHSV